MRLFLLAVLFSGVWTFVPCGAHAQRSLPSPEEAKVTADFAGIPLRRALATLFERVDARFTLEPAAPNPVITVRLKEMEFAKALQVVSLLADVSYVRNGNHYLFGRPTQIGERQPAAAPPAVAREEAKISLHYEGAPLRRALNNLFHGSGRQFAVEPSVPDIPITVSLREVDFSTALRTLTRLGGATATYRRDGGIYIIGLRTAEAPQAAVPPVGAAVRDGEPKITMDLINVPVREATELLFSRTGYQFAVEPKVPNIPITLRLRDVDFTTALHTLLRLAGATYRKEGPVYIVTAR